MGVGVAAWFQVGDVRTSPGGRARRSWSEPDSSGFRREFRPTCGGLSITPQGVLRGFMGLGNIYATMWGGIRFDAGTQLGLDVGDSACRSEVSDRR